MGTQPVYPQYGGTFGTQQASLGNNSGGGWQDFLKDNAGTLINFIGNMLTGSSNASAQKAALQLQAQEFGMQHQLAQNQQMMSAASQLNRAPLADKAQYLALNAAAPTPFQPRDYTQGTSVLRSGPPPGGAAAQLAANSAAASNYRKGAGGVDTSALNLVMRRLGGPQSMATNTTTTTNYGGKQYSPEEWSEYLNQHPELAGKGY